MRSVQRFAAAAAAERCELCSAQLAERHQHLIEPETRRVVCSCDGCAVLFDVGGVTRLRRIPRDVTLLRGFHLPAGAWEKLLIPVRLGFIYRSSRARSVIAAYPSPAGVTEASVDAGAWREIVDANPALAELREDVEALLVNRLDARNDYLRAPMDRCLELVGLVRTRWKGLSGGDDVWVEVRRYLEDLKESARP